MVEHLPSKLSKPEILSSSSSTAEKEKKKKKDPHLQNNQRKMN
jgi:hypothetical protein